MSQFETLKVTKVDDHLEVLINRPETLNALNEQVLSELEAAFSSVFTTPEVRAIVLAGAGEKAFVAGADISQMKDMNAQQAKAFAQKGQNLTRLMERMPQILIAKVHGFALGGGCELAMACDIIIASTSAKFGQPEVNLGLIPGFGGTQRLVRRVGLPVAMDMLCAGRNLTGSEAFQLGLVSRVCAPEELDNEVKMTLKKLAKTGPRAVAITKQMTRAAYQMNLDAGLDAEAHAFATCFADGEGPEGMRAFVEKRSASFVRKC